jgi:uncharacterized membrane protein
MKTIKNEIVNWLILAVPLIYLTLVYSRLPGIIPIHFHGETPDNYGNKTTLLWLIPLVTIGIYSLLFIIPKMTMRGKDQKPIYIIRLIINLVFCILFTITIYMVQSNANLKMATELIMIIVALLFLAIIFYTYYLIKTRSNSETVPTGESVESYKWGIFYYNPSNPKIWVPKRMGMGWTLNFAHPLSYLFLAVIIAVIIASYVFEPKH